MDLGEASAAGMPQARASDGLGDGAFDPGPGGVGGEAFIGALGLEGTRPRLVHRLWMDGDVAGRTVLGPGALITDRAGHAVVAGEREPDQATVVPFHGTAERAGRATGGTGLVLAGNLIH